MFKLAAPCLLDDDRLLRRVLKLLPQFVHCLRDVTLESKCPIEESSDLSLTISLISCLRMAARGDCQLRVAKIVASKIVGTLMQAAGSLDHLFVGGSNERPANAIDQLPSRVHGSLLELFSNLAQVIPVPKLLLAAPNRFVFFDALFFASFEDTVSACPGLLKSEVEPEFDVKQEIAFDQEEQKRINFGIPEHLRGILSVGICSINLTRVPKNRFELADHSIGQIEGIGGFLAASAEPAELLQYSRLKQYLALRRLRLSRVIEQERAKQSQHAHERVETAEGLNPSSDLVVLAAFWLHILRDEKLASLSPLPQIFQTFIEMMELSDRPLATIGMQCLSRLSEYPSLLSAALPSAGKPLKQIISRLGRRMTDHQFSDKRDAVVSMLLLACMCNLPAIRSTVTEQLRRKFGKFWLDAVVEEAADEAQCKTSRETTMSLLRLNHDLAIDEDSLARCGNSDCHKLQLNKGDFKKCARCKTVSYCSAECQKAHWKSGHKAECRAPGAASD